MCANYADGQFIFRLARSPIAVRAAPFKCFF